MVLGALFAGSVCGQGSFAGKVEAAPTDVTGSANIAVTGFKTTAGSFTLWSDGHITTVPRKPSETIRTVNPESKVSGAYREAPREMIPPTPPRGQMVGSPYVATGVLPLPGATYVLFSDGIPRLPSSSEASQGNSDRPVRSAFYNAVTRRTEGDSSLRVRKIGDGILQIDFDPPFTKQPTVVVSTSESGFVSGVGRVTPSYSEAWSKQLSSGNMAGADSNISIVVIGD